jgi:hypothetical protein
VAGGPFSHGQVPSVCNDANPTQQDFAKAYPTTRELLLARLLGKVQGANEGVVSSLCPIHTTDMSTPTQPDELYGYRPAMNAIADKLAIQLGHQCLPRRLDHGDADAGSSGVSCLVLGMFPSEGAPASCASVPGWKDPDPEVLARFKSDRHHEWQLAGDPEAVDLSTELTCELQQLAPNERCDRQTTQSGWCYVDDGSIPSCPQAILFSPGVLKEGVQTRLDCLEASTSVTSP